MTNKVTFHVKVGTHELDVVSYKLEKKDIPSHIETLKEDLAEIERVDKGQIEIVSYIIANNHIF